jgi:PAS domain S-box-containing protein
MTLPPAVEFGAQLIVLLVAVAAAVALAREPGRGAVPRVGGALGFLALAAAEAVEGAGVAGEGDPTTTWIRLGGYVFLFGAALSPEAKTRTASLPAVAPVPGGAITPAAVGLAAGLLTAVRRRVLAGGPWLGFGVMLFGLADLIAGLDRDWAGSASMGVRVAGAVAVARTVLAITRYRLRLRFLAGFTGLLLAVVLLVSVAIGTVIDRNLRAGAFDRLVGQAEDARRNLVDLASDEVRRLVVLGEVGRIADTIRAGGVVRRPLITELRDRLLPDVDFVLFLDRRGGIRGGTGLDGARAIEVVGTEAVDSAIREGIEVSSLDALSGGGLALLGVAPIRPPGAGLPAGFAVAGFLVNQELLDREVIAGRGTRAAAFQGFRGSPPELVAAAGFVDEPSAPTDVIRHAFLRFLEGGATVARAIDLGGGEHFAALAPLRQAVGRPVGILVVAEPAGVLAATRRAVNEVLFLVAVAVMGLAFLVALVAARRITGPLSALTDAARRVQAGDLRATAEVRGQDEVADLSVAFNRMTGSVATMTEELRVAAAEQSRLRARLETVLDSMGDGLVAVDADGTVATSNPAAASILGRPREELAGLSIRDVLVGHDAAGRSLEEVAWSPGGLAFVERPEGGEAPVTISSAPLRDAGGEPIGRVYVLRDMSVEYQVERMKREFLANVSHELRTPLTPIIGYSELMMKRELPGEQSKEFAANILESARRLERIVGMLVDFSMIEAGRLPVATEPLDVTQVLDEAAAAWKRRSARHNFEVNLDGPLPAAQVNPSLFRRMLDELVDNAVKYSPDGGRVRIGAASRNSNGRPMLLIEVSDQGIGIEDRDLGSIFEGFSQVDASDTRSFGGLGLGLTFVKRLAEAHGGAVTATSSPGQGSTFSFTVPAADDAGVRS